MGGEHTMGVQTMHHGNVHLKPVRPNVTPIKLIKKKE